MVERHVQWLQPLFAVLDEATSAINPDEEERLYTQVWW
jgi:ABC-type uncharacterized transport system fused permease/ATPase subunit